MIDKYAVIGNPISHSKSPDIHTMFANQTNQAMEYTTIQAEVGSFNQAVQSFIANKGRGLNVTLPFKQDAFRLANHLSDIAQKSGAVNTLIIESNAIIRGDNTDGIGLVRDLKQNLDIPLQQCRILIIGAGGAVRGILPSLFNEKPAAISLVNRTESKTLALTSLFAELYDIKPISFKSLSGHKFDLIINGTSSSLDNTLPPLPDNILEKGGYCYDLMYADKPTIFVKWGFEQGASQSTDGIGMLVEQAAESFFLWRKIRPETQIVIQALKQDLTPID